MFAGIGNAQSIPSVVEPGNLDRSLNEKLPYIDQTEIIVPEINKESIAPDVADEILFGLREVIIEGSTVYNEEDLLPLYNDYLFEEIALSKIYELANQITEMYLEDGYTLSFALVPVQRIKDGVVKLKVVEGYISDIVIDGRYEGSQRILKKWKEAIVNQRPARGDKMVDFLLTLKRLPGTDATALLEKSDSPNSSVLRLIMKHKFFEGSIEANNFGSRFVGPYLNQNNMTFNSLFGLSEKITFSNSLTMGNSEFFSNSLSYQMPINSKGTTVSASVSNSVIEPGYSLAISSVDSESYSTQVAISHPLIHKDDHQLDIGASFNTYNSQTDILGQVNSQDRLRFFKLSGDYSVKGDNNSYSFMNLTYSRGFDILNSSDPDDPLLSREGGRSDFNKFNIFLGHSRYLKPNINMFISGSGQWSETQLLSSEEFGFGGRLFGRGYNYSEFNGDNGIANSIQLTYIGKTKFKSAPEYHIYSFYDWSMLWDINSLGTDDRKSAASAGFGIRIPSIKDFSLLFEFSKPLTRPASSRGGKDDDDIQMLFSVKKQFQYNAKEKKK